MTIVRIFGEWLIGLGVFMASACVAFVALSGALGWLERRDRRRQQAATERRLAERSDRDWTAAEREIGAGYWIVPADSDEDAADYIIRQASR